MNLKLSASVGDGFDRLSILMVKSENIADAKGVESIRREIAALESDLACFGVPQGFQKLREVNALIFRVMEELFGKNPDDSEFAELCWRSIELNKDRAYLKKSINEETKSELVEVKSYF